MLSSSDELALSWADGWQMNITQRDLVRISILQDGIESQRDKRALEHLLTDSQTDRHS